MRSILNVLKRRGCGGQQVADFFGIDRRQISRWRAGATSPAADKLEGLRRLLGDAERKNMQPRGDADVNLKPDVQPRDDADVNLKPNVQPQGPIPGPIQVPFAPAEAEKMPVPIKKDSINRGVTCPKSDETHDVSLLSESSPSTEDRHCREKGTAEKDEKLAKKKESRIEGKPGRLCGRCPYRNQAFVGERGGSVGGTMLVGSGPSESDAKSGRAYSGRIGLRLESHLRDAKIDPNLCVGLTRVFKGGGVGRWFQRGGLSYQQLLQLGRSLLRESAPASTPHGAPRQESGLVQA